MASVNCSSREPFASEVLADRSASNIALLVIGGLLTLAVLGIFLWEAICIRRHRMSWGGRECVICLLGKYPVIAFLSFLTLLVPRSGILMDLTISVYLSLCMLTFIRLIVFLHGGREQMLLTLSDDVLNMRGPPCCCCCFCLPKPRITDKVIDRVGRAVFQLVIIRPLLMLILAVLWANGSINPGTISPTEPSLYLVVLNFISTGVAIYGLILLFRVSRRHLRKYSITLKFVCLQLAIIFTNVQNNIISILVRFNVIPCVQLFDRAANGERIDHFALIIVMFLLSLLAYYAYRKELSVDPVDDAKAEEKELDGAPNQPAKNDSNEIASQIMREEDAQSSKSNHEANSQVGFDNQAYQPSV